MTLVNRMRGDIPAEIVREGVTQPWMVSERALEALKNYKIKDDDVWITTYPKAGTHWAVEIANLILNDGVIEKLDRTKQPTPVEFDFTQPGTTILPGLPPHFKVPMYEKCKRWPSPRIFMTHLPEQMMPRQIYEGKGKVIFVIRNPKDLAISMWHFLRPTKRNPNYEHWDTFLDHFLTEEVVYSSWFTYNLTFWNKHRDDENFLFLKYEDMMQDLRGAVVRVANFLQHSLSDETLDRVVKLSKLESMKERFNSIDDTSGKRKIGAPSMIRKGIVGDWKSQFTSAQNEAFDKLFHERMEGSGLHIDFEINEE